LNEAIDELIASGDKDISKQIYLKHLSYTCDTCNGYRDLLERLYFRKYEFQSETVILSLIIYES
jgi:gamma-glutamyl-gamma-aminobutyrate hydrolase PuuD